MSLKAGGKKSLIIVITDKGIFIYINKIITLKGYTYLKQVLFLFVPEDNIALLGTGDGHRKLSISK